MAYIVVERIEFSLLEIYKKMNKQFSNDTIYIICMELVDKLIQLSTIAQTIQFDMNDVFVRLSDENYELVFIDSAKAVSLDNGSLSQSIDSLLDLLYIFKPGDDTKTTVSSIKEKASNYLHDVFMVKKVIEEALVGMLKPDPYIYEQRMYDWYAIPFEEMVNLDVNSNTLKPIDGTNHDVYKLTNENDQLTAEYLRELQLISQTNNPEFQIDEDKQNKTNNGCSVF